MAIIEEVPDAPNVEPARFPFDEASVAQSKQLRQEAAAQRALEPPLQFRLRRYIHTLPFLSPVAFVVFALFFLSALHAASIYLFTRGFLLSRQSLTEINDCTPVSIKTGRLDPSCTLPATHDRLIFLVVDALRADFLLPSSNETSAHHNHLPLPARLSIEDPSHSFLAHFIADAPTTTVQRLQGLTTGSLPTFVDVGSNFGGAEIVEDNWLSQAKRAGKRLAFVGDETWLGAFPSQKEGQGVWGEDVRGYDSFNVEDLDTVDNGVAGGLRRHLASTGEWDILIAHSLGLDHAGHKFGANHAQATRKLRETQALLEEVVSKLDDKTLLVVVGDHGMTDHGDHGGDSRDEVDAGLWVYSKGVALTSPGWTEEGLYKTLDSSSIDAYDLGDQFFLPWEEKGVLPARSVSQVDLVPTLSLLLGLPIPFGSLGLPIPELFFHEAILPRAVAAADPTPPKVSLFGRPSTPGGASVDNLTPLQTLLHAHLLVGSQLSHYMTTYTSLPTGKALRPYLPELHFLLSLAQSSYRGTHAADVQRAERERAAIVKFWNYGRKVRERARSVWSKFDLWSIGVGLALWLGSVVVGVRLYQAAKSGATARFIVGQGVEGAIVAGWGGIAIALLGVLPKAVVKPKWLVALLVAGAEVGVLTSPIAAGSLLLHPSRWNLISLLPLIAHASIFASNSLTVFEDRIVLFLLVSQLLVTLIKAFSAPEAQLRTRLIAYTSCSLVCIRLISTSTICREEQGTHCVPSFHLDPSGMNAWIVLGLAGMMTWFIPTLLRRALRRSASDEALAPAYLSGVIRTLLLGAVAYWTLDQSIAGSGGGGGEDLSAETVAFLVRIKTHVARTVLVLGVLMASLVWYNSPLCLRVQRQTISDGQGGSHTQVQFIGFANAFGASYLLYFATVFSLVFLVNSPPGQIVLGLYLVTLLCLLEVFDAERDVEHLRDSITSAVLADFLNTEIPPTPATHKGPTFSHLSTLALLSHLVFFATGHQAALSSIEWSSAFIGFPTLVYPFSPILVVVQTLGSFILTALAVPLFVMWTVSPTLRDQPPHLILRHIARASFGYSTYLTVVGLSSALGATGFKRHLMVWKVWTPRFMLGGVVGLMTDVVVAAFAVGWGTTVVVRKVRGTLGTKLAE